MPRYYFNVHDDDVTADEEGVLLADAYVAIAFAYKAPRALAFETALDGRLFVDHRVDILDAERRTIDTVTFGEAVGIQA